MKKILSNPFFHVSIIFVLVFLSIIFIRQHQKNELAARVEFLKGGPVVVERTKSTGNREITPSATQAEPAATNNEPSSNLNQDHSSNTNMAAAQIEEQERSLPSTSSTSSSSTTLAAAAMAARNETAPAGKMKMIISYVEVDQNVLNSWIDESRATGMLRPFDNVDVGPLLQVEQKVKGYTGVKLLQKIERTLDTSNGSQEWFVGTHHGLGLDNEMGFFSSLLLTESKDGLIHGEIEVQRAFRDPKDTSRVMERISYGSNFELPPGAGLFLTRLMPRKYVAEMDESMNPDPVLNIFKSQRFISGLTEFTLVVQFVTPESK